MSNVVLMDSGLTYAISAANAGPLIAIKYFLPVYDYRIDSNVHNGEDWGTSAIDLSASALSDDTTPHGEIIYNIDETIKSYDFSDTDNYVFLDGTENVNSATGPGGTWEISASVMSKEQYINLYDDTPMFDCVSGTSVQYVSASPTEGYWVVEGAGIVSGDNSIPAETSTGTNYFFPITDYYPVTDGSTVRGSWKCRLTKNIGNVKFNKIALYCVQIDGSGNEVGSPVLFAQAMLSSPVVKTNFAANGFDDVVIDVQVKIDSLTADFSEVFHSTSGDYWSRTPGGLYYAENIGIGTFTESLIAPQARLDIKPSDDTSHIRLRNANDDNHYLEMSLLSATNDLQISATSGDVIFKGDVYIDGLYGNNTTMLISASDTVDLRGDFVDVNGFTTFYNTIDCRQACGVTGDLSAIGTNSYIFADNNYFTDMTIVNKSDNSKRGHIAALSDGNLQLSASNDVRIFPNCDFLVHRIRPEGAFWDVIDISADGYVTIDSDVGILLGGNVNGTTFGYPYLKHNGNSLEGVDVGTVADDVFGDRFHLITSATDDNTFTTFNLPSGFSHTNTMVMSIQINVGSDWYGLWAYGGVASEDYYSISGTANSLTVTHYSSSLREKNIKILLYKTS